LAGKIRNVSGMVLEKGAFGMTPNGPLADLMHRIAGIHERAWYNSLKSRRDWALAPTGTRTESAMPANEDDTHLPFCQPILGGKKIAAGFDGGTISLDGGVILLAGADGQLGPIERLAARIPDERDPDQITHTMADLMRARLFAIACGYPQPENRR